MTRSLPVALLAGGLATRLRPLTETIPKSLVEVAGEPFIAHQLRLFNRRGVERVVICAGHLGAMIEDFVGTGADFGVSVFYSWDGPTQAGTGGAIKKAAPVLGEEFVVVYGDSWLDTDYNKVIAAFRASGQPALMTVFRNEDHWDASNVIFEDGRIAVYDKKQKSPRMKFIDWGMGIFRASVFDAWPDSGAFDLADVYVGLVRDRALAGYEIGQRFYEIGSMEGLAETDRLLRKGR